jgi:hypothetical protein
MRNLVSTSPKSENLTEGLRRNFLYLEESGRVHWQGVGGGSIMAAAKASLMDPDSLVVDVGLWD